MNSDIKRIIVGVAILLTILLCVAIYLPSFLTSRTAAYESLAMEALHSLYKAQIAFRSQAKNGRYGTLEELTASGLIDTELASGKKGGYRFELDITENTFEAHAVPLVYGHMGFSATGRYSFYINDKRLLTRADKRGSKASAADESVW